MELPSSSSLGSITRLFKQNDDAVDIVMKLLSETHVDLADSKSNGMKS